MKTKQEQIDEVWKIYNSIVAPVAKAYSDRLDEIYGTYGSSDEEWFVHNGNEEVLNIHQTNFRIKKKLKREAVEAYKSIQGPALKAAQAKAKKIDEQEERAHKNNDYQFCPQCGEKIKN